LVALAGWGVRRRGEVAALKDYLAENAKAFLQEHVFTPVRASERTTIIKQLQK
jgi:hypothetical protein